MADPAAALPASPAKSPRRLDLFALAVRFQSVIGLVLVIIGGIVFSPRRHGSILFLSPDNVANIVRAISETGIIAVGMTFVIITAGIDLSVGALLSLSSVLTATMMVSAGWGLVPTLLAVMLAGIAFGTCRASFPRGSVSSPLSSPWPVSRWRAAWRWSSRATNTSTSPMERVPVSRLPCSRSSVSGSSGTWCPWPRSFLWLSLWWPPSF